MQRLQDAGGRGGGAPGGRQAHQAHQQPRQRRAHARTTPQREQLSPQPSTRRRSLAGHQHTCKPRLTRTRAPQSTQNDPPSHARQERASETRPSMHSKGGDQPCRKGGDVHSHSTCKSTRPSDRPAQTCSPVPPRPPSTASTPLRAIPPLLVALLVRLDHRACDRWGQSTQGRASRGSLWRAFERGSNAPHRGT